MIVRAIIGYRAQHIAKTLSREDWETLREAVWGLQLPKWEEGKDRPSWYSYGTETLLDAEQDFIWLDRFDIPYEVKNFKNTYKAKITDPQGNTTNINIAISNIGLLAINEVTWLDDACTESLQDHLDNGWRILAVCPPNGTRRPDYILGRTKG